jgi:hypothetical protein
VFFYRVCHRTRKENAQGRSINMGPYTCNREIYTREIRNGLADMNEEHSTDNVHLSVGWEWGIFDSPFNGEFVCGFTSLEKLAEWFKGYFELFFVADFVARVWDIPSRNIEHGKVQSVTHIDFMLNDPIREISFDEIDRIFGKDIQHV